MIYAQFYHESTGASGPKTDIEMCGSDGVCIIDGRLSFLNRMAKAREHGKKLTTLGKAPTGFKIMQGDFSHNQPLTGFTRISTGKQLEG